ncbi:hypothetical protein ACFYM3_30780 [Streptomyces massasporeus]|uniref:Uncharacterized protein n=1 Tax=Streptomyces massasporeus TaxID=67324 RepID=A0ABW6LKI4_9ACTN
MSRSQRELVTSARKYAPGPVLMEVRLTACLVEVSEYCSWSGSIRSSTATPANGLSVR